MNNITILKLAEDKSNTLVHSKQIRNQRRKSLLKTRVNKRDQLLRE